MPRVPNPIELAEPVLQAIKDLGGSGRIQEIDEKVVENLGLPDDAVNLPHKNGSQTALEYRLAWARTLLRQRGMIQNSSRGVWSIVQTKPQSTTIVTATDAANVRKTEQTRWQTNEVESSESVGNELAEELQPWRAKLYQVLTQRLSPAAFERLVMRPLRECGFIQVQVTG